MNRRVIQLGKRENKGVSTVFGSLLLTILLLTLASTLFVALYRHNEAFQQAVDLEEERSQEKIVMVSMTTENISGIEYVTAVLVKNACMQVQSLLNRFQTAVLHSSFYFLGFGGGGGSHFLGTLNLAAVLRFCM